MFGNLVQTRHAGTYKGIQMEKISSQKIHKAKKEVLNENAFCLSLSHTHTQTVSHCFFLREQLWRNLREGTDTASHLCASYRPQL